MLQISPTELSFVFASNCELQNVLNLRNTLEDGRSVAFKVKCNTADRYLVRPTSGYVKPGASVNIKVFMLPQSEYSDELRSCKDRFLIQSAPVDGSTEQSSIASVLATYQRQDFKISVTVVRGPGSLQNFHLDSRLRSLSHLRSKRSIHRSLKTELDRKTCS